MTGRAFVAGLLALSLAWSASLLLAPLLLEPGTVRGLDGNASVLDYPDLWASMPPFEQAVYTFGDINCHQMEHRSWIIHGNQMPVDVRMASGFLAGNVGLLVALRAPAMARVRDGAVHLIPGAWRRRLVTPRLRLLAAMALWAVAIGPAAIDVAAQGATEYESTNAVRLVTGAWLGVVGGFLIGALFASLWIRPETGPSIRGPSARSGGTSAQQTNH